MKLTELDYEYLKGEWTGPYGAAINLVMEDCRHAGYGEYGEPTERGKKAMADFELEKRRRENLGSG